MLRCSVIFNTYLTKSLKNNARRFEGMWQRLRTNPTAQETFEKASLLHNNKKNPGLVQSNFEYGKRSTMVSGKFFLGARQNIVQ